MKQKKLEKVALESEHGLMLSDLTEQHSDLIGVVLRELPQAELLDI